MTCIDLLMVTFIQVAHIADPSTIYNDSSNNSRKNKAALKADSRAITLLIALFRRALLTL